MIWRGWLFPLEVACCFGVSFAISIRWQDFSDGNCWIVGLVLVAVTVVMADSKLWKFLVGRCCRDLSNC
jgi:hypothetical protein